jgi:hypothetical protein
MSETAKKKRTKRTHKPSHQTTDEVPMGIVWREDKHEEPLVTKIVFLGKENLEKLRGYKAFLDLWSDGQVCLTLTGIRPKSAKALFESIDKMKDDEIHAK